MKETHIYALELEYNRYFIGSSENPVEDIKSHMNGEGCKWTRTFKPVEVIETYKVPLKYAQFYEDELTLKYKKKHGDDVVRGGAWLDFNNPNKITTDFFADNHEAANTVYLNLHKSIATKIKAERKKYKLEDIIKPSEFNADIYLYKSPNEHKYFVENRVIHNGVPSPSTISGNGWAREHNVCQLIKKFLDVNNSKAKELVFMLMDIHGYENVRGYSYRKPELEYPPKGLFEYSQYLKQKQADMKKGL